MIDEPCDSPVEISPRAAVIPLTAGGGPIALLSHPCHSFSR